MEINPNYKFVNDDLETLNQAKIIINDMIDGYKLSEGKFIDNSPTKCIKLLHLCFQSTKFIDIAYKVHKGDILELLNWINNIFLLINNRLFLTSFIKEIQNIFQDLANNHMKAIRK